MGSTMQRDLPTKITIWKWLAYLTISAHLGTYPILALKAMR